MKKTTWNRPSGDVFYSYFEWRFIYSFTAARGKSGYQIAPNSSAFGVEIEESFSLNIFIFLKMIPNPTGSQWSDGKFISQTVCLTLCADSAGHRDGWISEPRLATLPHILEEVAEAKKPPRYKDYNVLSLFPRSKTHTSFSSLFPR